MAYHKKGVVVAFSKNSDREELNEALQEIKDAKKQLSITRLDLDLSNDVIDQMNTQDKQITLVENLIAALVKVKDCEDALDGAEINDIEEAPPEMLKEAIDVLKNKQKANDFSKNTISRYFNGKD